ncbi:hypothetical protein FPOAC2_06661 [Fusarium poae]|uniref:hypothetical protein n=1 Tax=Fusarium poae TaxID=36050 RepID=UPI001CE943D0|nr:hypothetical protein FPOAC1_006533 [Fusarium poae]KAG8673224.1 hypothetical protein FPOAC1_006533 [Fusarium poae]
MTPSTQTPFALILAEMVVSITTVILFGLEYPADFRSRLWENGGELGYNSNPNQRIYFYANHLEPPEVPFIWSQSLAASNLAIAMLGLVVFVARTIMSRVRYLPHHINIIYDMILLSLWATSLAGQTSGDFSDPKHPSPHPWYLTRGCSVSWDRTRGYCQTAQAGFAISAMAGILYGARLIREIVLVAYARGQQHRSKEFILNPYDVESTESLYTDGEWVSSEQKASRNSLVLSPVLAFFPSDSESRW